MIHLTEYIGEAATYENLAEECTELAKAALKYARYLRGENPLAPNTNDAVLKYNVKEEATDVIVLLEEIGLEHGDNVIYAEKVKRMMGRMVDAGKTRNKA